ncbi:ankyrin repeat domain-containing protein [Asticcacaulis sp. AC402]|uniref:ankyrin repeat domain-containing protein n=1 Tax=Asticcacaulis sp. AC402 TaxID=1282361 RepID=UPI0003C3D9B1|nr:ankyrin repeat domain-containing protein [Asticcacaulis sp. AC402]ESQ75152.1 hypothetical protein ABAC402_10815 [Asticcacaulis sp. AC402]
MAKPKKKQLPKTFEDLLKASDIEALKAVFDTHELDARGGYTKHTAQAYGDCPDELTRWLVAKGADLMATDTYGDTPLHARAGSWQGHVEILLELGADVHHATGLHGTPLHVAATRYRPESARTLLKYGARVDALDRENVTPLERALRWCQNTQIEAMAELAGILLVHGARVTPEIKTCVTRIGGNFEFHRSSFNPELLETTSNALETLYRLHDVPSVPRRRLHDGTSPIIAKAARWQDRHEELWEMLIPSKGPAATVQGEVLRIGSRIVDELDRNGGVNWDANYRKMAQSYARHVASGASLPETMLSEVRDIVARLNGQQEGPQRLCELAVEWISRNPVPVKLPRPDYNR